MIAYIIEIHRNLIRLLDVYVEIQKSKFANIWFREFGQSEPGQVAKLKSVYIISPCSVGYKIFTEWLCLGIPIQNCTARNVVNTYLCF